MLYSVRFTPNIKLPTLYVRFLNMELVVYRSAKAVWVGGVGQGPPQTTGSITSPAYAIQAETVFAKAYFSMIL